MISFHFHSDIVRKRREREQVNENQRGRMTEKKTRKRDRVPQKLGLPDPLWLAEHIIPHNLK